VNNYAALSNRWKANKRLKIWWSSLSPAAKVEWYRKEQSHCSGQKRDFSQVGYMESATQQSVNSRLALYNHIPVSVFIRQKFLENVSRAAAILQFEAIVNSNRQQCIFENGQWHVPDYAGIQSSCGVQTLQGFTVSRSNNMVDDATTLRNLTFTGSRMVEAASSSDSRAALTFMPQQIADAPHIARNPADSARAPAPSSVVLSEVEKEAHKQTIKNSNHCQSPRNNTCLRLGVAKSGSHLVQFRFSRKYKSGSKVGQLLGSLILNSPLFLSVGALFRSFGFHSLFIWIPWLELFPGI